MKHLITAIIIIFCFIACAPTTSKNWKSVPSYQAIQNKCYEARLEPVKKENPFFTFFLLTIRNNTVSDLEIDWNKSRYIYNNSAQDRFAFNGIVPEDIKNMTVPPDIIARGETLSKEIAPVKLIAFTPYRVSSLSKKDSGINPGVIPAGDNGIYLVVRCNGKEVKKKITITIEAEETPR